MNVTSKQDVGGTQAPASTQKKNTKDMGKDQFLTLLIEQLKNQDPLAPMDNTEFTQQMATFSNLEQMFKINDNLVALQQISASANSTQSLGLIGKDVMATGDSVFVGADGTAAPINFNLSEDVTSAVINVLDSTGSAVRRIDCAAMSAGAQEYKWDGRGDDGQPLAAGMYKFVVSATGRNGKDLQVDPYMTGRVDSISLENGITYAHVGGSKLMMSDITKISLPTAGSATY